MSKIYDKKTVAHIQSLLKTGQVVITSAESYDTLLPGMRISLGEIQVAFVPVDANDKSKGYSTYSFLSDNVTKEYKAEWKCLPIGSHLVKDMRKLVKDKDGNIPYKTLEYTDQNGKQMKALVRHLFEIDDMDADQPECVEYYEKYTDLLLNNQCYLIVKIISANSNYCHKEKLNINGANVITPFETSITPIADTANNISEDSIPLF